MASFFEAINKLPIRQQKDLQARLMLQAEDMAEIEARFERKRQVIASGNRSALQEILREEQTFIKTLQAQISKAELHSQLSEAV